MIVFRDIAEVPPGFGPSVVAIGKFDGVHTGHRAVIEQARTAARGTRAQVVAVTFDRNPLALLRPDRCPEELVGPEEKLRLLEQAGVDATLMLEFNHCLADMAAEEFVRTVLTEALHAEKVLLGADFRFGRGGKGDAQLLIHLGAETGFEVVVLGDNELHGRRVSSSWVRDLLSEGDVSGAAKLLGRHPSVRGEVVHGAKRGRELGFPTANLGGTDGFITADGVYAGWLIDPAGAGGIQYPAAISVGTNPTFDDVTKPQVEAYVLDETELNLYGHHVEAQFVRRIRGMTAFDGVQALVAQITADVQRVRSVLAELEQSQ